MERGRLILNIFLTTNKFEKIKYLKNKNFRK